ncbi:MAG: FAD-dependent oxidoreductase [Novosphingobium sp.]|nr:MAG: FAD-dependent oxidoreductase [Novosphingobium sp.]
MAKTRNKAELPVAIVGAGFSGTLLAINLLRHGENVVLVEREEAQLAKGLAFGTRQPEHLLNVRAANMSAFPDDLGHFLRWMGFSSDDQANRFVPRLAYGRYLRELLIDALAAAPDRAQVRAGEAVAARFDGGAITLSLAGGAALECRALVLALGNFAPTALPVLADLPPGLHFADPWRPGATDGLDAIEHIVLVGSGLTAIDAILSLDRAGYRGRMTALSRRGLKPRSHAESGPVVRPVAEPEASGAALVRAVRQRAESLGWRAAIDELRPHTQHIWRRHDEASQRRFLRHLRPYWDVHRHRLAPTAASRIAALEGSGRLAFVAGKLVSAEAEGTRARLRWRPRGSASEQVLPADRIISCIGPEGDVTRAGHPLLDDLIAQGRARADAHRLGVDVEQSGRLRNAAGEPQDGLYAVGPLTKGEAWEIVAVPDIRRQVWDLARYLGSAHWVGGEGL